MTDIVAELRESTEAMASSCSVPMDLWNEHSNAALSAAIEIERLRAIALDMQAAYVEAADRAEEAVKAASALQDEIKRLRLSLSEARATGRREGMESMISWHAKEIERLDEQIAENNAYRIRVGSVYTSRANKYCADNKYFHEKSIAAIRAAMENEE